MLPAGGDATVENGPQLIAEAHGVVRAEDDADPPERAEIGGRREGQAELWLLTSSDHVAEEGGELAMELQHVIGVGEAGATTKEATGKLSEMPGSRLSPATFDQLLELLGDPILAEGLFEACILRRTGDSRADQCVAAWVAAAAAVVVARAASRAAARAAA